MKWLLDRILEASRSRPTAVKIVTFGMIGLCNAMIDLAVFALAYRVFELTLVLSNVLAWLVAVSASYVMNTMITFRAESGRILRLRDYLSFAASGTLGVFAATTTLVVLSHYFTVIAAKMFSILAGFIVNFTMSHFVVFRPKIPPGTI